MTQKPSLHEALHKSSAQRKKIIEAETSSARETKKLIVVIPTEAHLQIDQMKRDLRRRSMKDVVTEALNDLFKKYEYPPIA
ncbi:MAG: hypothetical protein ACD_16C00121G0016 [uncultured bacterium]|nr:MAG: hypothetical protein ACD_16C00121G0016 [uncultured bacterium]OGT69184.1 MAG: hypothetical protein A3I12_06420 [Gammaproteobacteria bacterium RIFCSPLOWO2_02_FULL_38_11]HBG34593.1 hypothetical protein [Holosporales bacterium]HLD79866.1 hypothetical protein [Candidatus Nanoarchaeia archaeon]HLE24079.1 hypothetical protein [Thermodesulfobacteriota bacterium]